MIEFNIIIIQKIYIIHKFVKYFFHISPLTYFQPKSLHIFPGWLSFHHWRVMKNVVLFSFILLFVLLIFCANRTYKNEESSWLMNEAQSFYHHVKVNSHSGYEHIWPVSFLHPLLCYVLILLFIPVLKSGKKMSNEHRIWLFNY
jgi:hypothetical protein